MAQKRVNKTKEQLGREMKNQQEVARKRKILIEQLYPSLVEATVSVDEAKMLIQSINSTMMEQVLSWMQERQFSEIIDKMVERLCPDGDRKEEVLKLLETLKDENVFVAKELTEGITRVIEQMIHDEMKDRELDTLTPDWDRYLN